MEIKIHELKEVEAIEEIIRFIHPKNDTAIEISNHTGEDCEIDAVGVNLPIVGGAMVTIILKGDGKAMVTGGGT